MYSKVNSGERLAAYLRNKGVNQSELAERTAVSRQSVNNYVNSKTEISVRYIFELKKCFPNLNMNWLLFGEGDMDIGDLYNSGDPELQKLWVERERALSAYELTIVTQQSLINVLGTGGKAQGQ